MHALQRSELVCHAADAKIPVSSMMQMLGSAPISLALLPTEAKALRVLADTSCNGWCDVKAFVRLVCGAFRQRTVRAAWSSGTTDAAVATEAASLRAVRHVSTATLARVISKVRAV
jgi:hypothetical protein